MTQEKILVVEDDQITLMEIQRLLERCGYQSFTASSGKKALQIAIEIEPDLILMDVKLKGGDDGVTTAQRIKELINVPLIYLTAVYNPQLMESIKLTQPSACIFKPFRSQELVSNIEIALYNFNGSIN
jgi:CheY-like chemotaxis protein